MHNQILEKTLNLNPQCRVSETSAVQRDEARQPASALWEIRALSMHYKNTCAFHKVTLDINKGKTMAVVGQSGCGKSSFLNCLNGLYRLFPDCELTGEARIDNINLLASGLDEDKLRRKVGMIFQRPNPFAMSIWRNLELPLKEHGVRDKQKRAWRIESALKNVGLWGEVQNRLHSSALSLSGGQQQRLCIARALVLKPKAILMDEPCSALDPIATQTIEELIFDLKKKYTLVIVTHSLPQAARIADDLAFFWLRDNRGALIESGSCKQMFNNPREKLTQQYFEGAIG